MLAQYAGRLHRLHLAKRELIVHECVDREAPLLRRISERRIRGYRSLGCAAEDGSGLGLWFRPLRARRAQERPRDSEIGSADDYSSVIAYRPVRLGGSWDCWRSRSTIRNQARNAVIGRVADGGAAPHPG